MNLPSGWIPGATGASRLVLLASLAAAAPAWGAPEESDRPIAVSAAQPATLSPAQIVSADVSELTMTVGTGVVIDCPDGISRLAASSPEIVDAVTASPREVLFHAKSLGRATMVVWSKVNQRKTYNVTVEPNLEPLRKLLRETFPGEQMDVVAAKESLALVGHATSQAAADRALALVSNSVKGAISNVNIAPPGLENEVALRVRFAELDRTTETQFGASAYPEICEEFAVLNLEMRAGKRRAEALHNLAERAGVEDLKKLVAVLIQTDRFGTSISQTLRRHSEYMRTMARQRAEEKAAKLAVKLVFPIFFCVLPSLFVVTVGPVLTRLVRDLFPMFENM